MLECYQTVNQAVGDLAEQEMTDHSYPVPGLSKVTYQSGTVIYVNYNETEAEADGHTVPAGGYLRVDGEG